MAATRPTKGIHWSKICSFCVCHCLWRFRIGFGVKNLSFHKANTWGKNAWPRFCFDFCNLPTGPPSNWCLPSLEENTFIAQAFLPTDSKGYINHSIHEFLPAPDGKKKAELNTIQHIAQIMTELNTTRPILEGIHTTQYHECRRPQMKTGGHSSIQSGAFPETW